MFEYAVLADVVVRERLGGLAASPLDVDSSGTIRLAMRVRTLCSLAAVSLRETAIIVSEGLRV